MCAEHERFMRRAVTLSADRMRANAGGPFGAVVVRNGEVIAEGCNLVTSANDPTAHAEVVAIREACKTLDTFSLAGCAIYTSCEPCPMCLAAIYWARLDAVYFANTREEAADIGFDDAFLYREVSTPLSDRTLPTHRIVLPEAAAIFEEWRAKPDKIQY